MAINNVTTNTKPEKGITYSAITDSSVDWTGVTNSTYFYDKATDLPYYKNSSGTVVSLFEEGGGGTDTFVTGGTYSGSTIILNRNDGNAVNVTGITSNNISNADLTLDANRVLNLDNNTLKFEGGQTYIDSGSFNPLVINRKGSGTLGNGIDFNAYNSSNAETNFARIIQVATDVTAGSEDGGLWLRTMIGGTLRTPVRLDNRELLIDATNFTDNSFRVLDGSTECLRVTTSKQTYIESGSFIPLVINRKGPGNQGNGIDFNAYNSSNVEHNFARVIQVATDTTAGSEDGGLWLRVSDNGNITTKVQIESDTTEVLNKTLLSKDAIVKGSDNSASTSGFKVTDINNNSLLDIKNNGATLITEKLELSTTTDGFLMPRLTTAQKNAISSPDTNLMVFDTDLSSLQRYNGTAWVAMAAGYGVIEVIKDSDNGNPTFYSDLQSALETCKTAGSSNTINIYSNITITSAININRGGSGVGNGYQYKNLTIDFNGFTLTNNEADSSYCFDVSFGNVASENRQITFKNGIVNRTSGTGTHYSLHCYETENDGRLLMDNMRWYCENSNTIRLKIDALDDNINSFGGSQFISDGGYTLYSGGYNSQNFNCLGNSSVGALIVIGSRLINFTTRNASTGIALQLGGGAEVSHFDSKSGEGVGVYCTDDFQGVANNFYVETTTGDGIETRGTNQNYKLKITNFEVRCGDGFAIANGHTNSIFSNYLVSNNSATKQTIIGGGTTTHSNGTAVNYGSGRAVKDANPSSLVYNNMTFISKGGIACEAYSDNAANNVFFYSCLFDSQWNDVGGHALIIGLSAGSANFSNCNFKVSNASANCINATASRAISVSNSNFNGSATPINSNITLNHLESDAFGNVTT